MSFESVLLEDLAAPQKNAIVGGPFGSNLVSKDYVDQGTPVIRGQNMGGRWVSGDFAYVSAMKADTLSPNKARPGDLIFTQRGTLGQVSIVPCGPYDEYIVSQSQMKVTLDPERVDVHFLYYVFRSPEQLEYIQNTAIQTGVPHTNLGILKKTPLKLPPIHTQRQIATTLGTLDDRITLLRETNTTLEAIAQALFKSWFVDFDPVRAKMEGRPPEGMDEATAALFACVMQETATGLVPEGWSEQVIRSVVAGVFDGPHATPPEADQGAVFLGIRNLTGTALDLSEVRHIAEADWERWTKRVTPRAGDIVFSYEATLGFFALIPSDLRCCLGRRLALIRPHEQAGTPHFWYHQFVSEPFQRLLVKHTIQGATVDRLALKSFPDLPVLVPPIELRERFDEVASPIWTRIHENQSQMGVLADLRDTLLPRLISGQLRVPEAQDLIEETC